MFSKLERFQPEKSSGPPVGAYNPKYSPKVIGPVSFKRSPRERLAKFNGPAVGQYDPKYPDYRVKSAVDLSKSKNEISFGAVSYLKPPSKFMPNYKLNKLKRRSKSADHLNSIETNSDRTISDGSFHEEDEKESLFSRINQQSGELLKKDEELEEMRKKLVRFETEQKMNAIQSISNRISVAVSTDVDNSETLRIQRINYLVAELSVLKQDRDNIKFESESLRNEIFALLPELNKQISLANGIMTNTNTFRDGLNEIIVEHDVLKQKFVEIQNELDRKINELHIVRMDYSILSQDFAKLMDTIESMNSAQSQAVTENKMLRRDFETKEVALLEKLCSLEVDLNEANKTNEFWTELKFGFDKIIAETDEQMVRVVDENEGLNMKLDSFFVSFKLLTDHIRLLKEELNDCREESDRFKRETASDFESLMEHFRALTELSINLTEEKNTLWKEKNDLLLVIAEQNKNKVEELEKISIVESLYRRYEEESKHFKQIADRLTEELLLEKKGTSTVEAKFAEQQSQLNSLTEENLRLADDKRLLIEQALAFCDQNDVLHQKVSELEVVVKMTTKSNEENVSNLCDSLNDVKNELHSLNVSHVNLCQRYDCLKSQQNTDLEHKYESLKAENSGLRINIASSVDEIERLKQLIDLTSFDLQISRQETFQYKSQLDDLIEKIKPFKEQLDLYQSERNVLTARENESEEALKALLGKYASLLSHQNQKQKIHHINKLKDEILKLRNENRDANKENAKLKCQMESLHDKLAKFEGKRRFDPKTAFCFEEKENQPLKSVQQNM